MELGGFDLLFKIFKWSTIFFSCFLIFLSQNNKLLNFI